MKGELSQLEISGAVLERNKAEVSVKEGVEKEIHQSCDGATKDPHYRYKMVKQICLVSGWICLGMASEITGRTLPDLKDRLGVNYELISWALVSKSLGKMIGSIAGGFIYDIFHAYIDLLNGGSLIIMSVSLVAIPWCPSLQTAIICFVSIGFSKGFLNTGGAILAIHLWKDKSASALHSLYFGCGLGALLCPQIARLFLSSDTEVISNFTNSSHPKPVTPISRLEAPYCIIGGLLFLFALVMVGLHIKGEPKDFPQKKISKNLKKKMSSCNSCSSGYPIFEVAMSLCTFIYFLHAIGGERAYGRFLFSFAFETGMMTKDEAIILQSVFWLTFTITRFAGMAFANYIPLSSMMIVSICFSLVSSTILAFNGVLSSVFLWVFTTMMAMGTALTLPNGISWITLNLSVSSAVRLIIPMMGIYSGSFIYQYLSGYLFEHKEPHSLMYLMVSNSLGLVVSYIAMTLVLKFLRPEKNMYTFNDNTNADTEPCQIIYFEKF